MVVVERNGVEGASGGSRQFFGGTVQIEVCLHRQI